MRDAVPVVAMAKKYIEPLIQIQDSYGERLLTDADLLEKAHHIFSTLKDTCSIWEIGNEVNGDWCSPNAAERVSEILKMVPSGHKTLLTLFWRDNLVEWFRENTIKTDYVGISFYPVSKWDIQSTRFDAITNRIVDINPDAKVLISEYGLEEWDGNLSWRGKSRVLNQLENMRIDHSAWIGNLGYWDWQGTDEE